MFANSFSSKCRVSISPVFVLIVLSMLPALALAASADAVNTLDLTESWFGYAAIALFVTAYALIIFEENIHLWFRDYVGRIVYYSDDYRNTFNDLL